MFPYYVPVCTNNCSLGKCIESNFHNYVDSVCPVISSGDGIDLPQKVLFPPERLNLKWTQVHRIGAGLQNMGNTCFLNSALQCLTYTPPFANYMLTREHSKTCNFLFHVASLHQQSCFLIVQSCNNYHINLVHFSSIFKLLFCLIHVFLINVLSICSCHRS